MSIIVSKWFITLFAYVCGLLVLWSRLYHSPLFSVFGVIFFEKSQLFLLFDWLEMGRNNPYYNWFVTFLWTVNDNKRSGGTINNDEGYPWNTFSNRGRTNAFVFVNRFIGWCDDQQYVMMIRSTKRHLKSTDYDMTMRFFMLVRWCLITFQVCMKVRCMINTIGIKKKN